jgi:hypothetical protein
VKLLDVVPNGWLVNPNDALGVPSRAPDKRDDVFGLACLGYEMLAGRHPFNGNTAQEAYRAGLEAERVDGVAEREWRALAGALAVHRDDRTPSIQQFLDEFGVGSSQRLKTVVATPSAPPPPAYVAPEPPPALARPVYAERPAREKPERRGILGTAVVILLLAGLAAAAWYYREPLTVFSGDLMAEVETRMSAERASADRAAPQPPAAGSPEAPLVTAPEVTDPEPAMVLAPGASAPPTAAAKAPEIEAPAVADAGTPEARAPVREQEPAVMSPAPDAAPPPTVIEPPTRPEGQGPATAAPEPSMPAAPIPAPSAPAAGPARFAFAQGSATVREGDVAARITIRRTGNVSGSASVSWWTAGGTAVADADYADLGARIERFEPGEASRTVYVPLTNDAVREPVKSFEVLLGRGEGADGADAMRVEIVDDD